MRVGVIVLQLGTPQAPTPSALRTYLREFLGDPRVLDMPAPARALLLNAVILPTRPKYSAKAYASIWTPEGSPLLVISQRFVSALQVELGEGYHVALGMRYGQPSIGAALRPMLDEGVSEIVLLPMYPQYASATTGSSLEHVFEILKDEINIPATRVIPPFFADTGFIDAVTANIFSVLRTLRADGLLFTYHGLPEKQLHKAAPWGHQCHTPSFACCAALNDKNRFCYRAQCMQTSRALVTALNAVLGDSAPRAMTSFQSRLGRTPWIQPYTEEILKQLPSQGVKRLAVVSPSFTADCLETLEELGERGKHTFLEAGGEAFELVPAVNFSSNFVSAAANWVKFPNRTEKTFLHPNH